MQPPSAATNVAKVVGLYVYPIKACQPISLNKTKLNSCGFQLDRIFCIVDVNGDRYNEKQALSQRQLPTLASIKVEFENEKNKKCLILSAPNMGTKLKVYTDEKRYEKNGQVLVECAGRSTTSNGGWSMGVLPGWNCGDEITRWLSVYLNDTEKSSGRRSKPLATFMLVRACSKDAARHLSTYAGPSQMPFSYDVNLQKEGKASPFRMRDVPVSKQDRVYYSDFAPLNIASVNSLNLLRDEMRFEENDDDMNSGSKGPTKNNDNENHHLPSKHPITCFRPNIVVLITNGNDNIPVTSSTNAFDEETWKYFQIGNDAKFRFLKRCPRCTVPARNPANGDWLYPKNKRLPQKTLKKMFPLKTIDKEWEEQWQGPTFGVHIGWDSEGEDSSEIKVGDDVNCFVFHNLQNENWGRIILSFLLTLGIAFIILMSILKISSHTNTIESMLHDLSYEL